MPHVSKKLTLSQEKFIKRCKKITEQILEESLEIEGEFLTEDDMTEMNFPEPFGYSETLTS